MAGPTPYVISTITALSTLCDAKEGLGKALDLASTFHKVPLGAYSNICVCVCKYDGSLRLAEDGSLCCGVENCRHRVINAGKKSTSGKLFGDQVTMVCKLRDSPDIASVKLFSNGCIHLTGARSIPNATRFVQELGMLLISCLAIATGFEWVDPMDAFRICMINSDCDIGFQVKRTDLVHVLCKHFPKLIVSYDPCMYPGVQIKFMWNQALSKMGEEGLCICNKRHKCKGDGLGDAEGRCRKVTIAVFQTGRVIITGAHTIAQLDAAYAFLMHDVVKRFGDEFKLLQP